jgi:hypothetical protein
MIKLTQAIYELYPQVTYTSGDIAYDAQDNVVEYNKAAVEAHATSKEYITKRASEYPPIGDQLDALFRAGVFPSDMAEQIQAIKDKYPKV